MYYIGIDIGSTCAKTVVLNKDKEIVYKDILPTGWSSVDTAEKIAEKLEQNGYSTKEYPCVATGYGRVAVSYADRNVTEITCHGKGAMVLHGKEDLTVIDIGGQDTKIICLENGQVQNFIMNDKCSAGTGRFLEVMANTLALKPEQLCKLAEKGGGVTISSMCTVFAESEVVSLIGRGEKKENIAYAVVDSIVRKVASQCSRMEHPTDVCLTGGLFGYDYIKTALGRALKVSIETSPNGHFAGAVGAAVCAMNVTKK